MEQIEQEKEYIMLLSISKYGYAAMPQDYSFLQRYTMLNLYYERLKTYSAGINTQHLDDAIKKHALLQMKKEVSIEALRKYKSTHSTKEVKILLDNNIYYWRVLLSELKK